MLELKEGLKIERELRDEAVAMLELERKRGVTMVNTICASAMLIGELIGASSRDLDHAKFGFEQMLSIMLATAQDRLAARAPQH
jgi:hypothetical protein